MKDFRPISLIGCVYKILAKILAGRVSKVINQVISEHQSAFIGNKLILDGVAVLNEAILEAKRKKVERIIFKIDFEKAYDTVDWEFLDSMLDFFNFNRK